MMKEPKIDLNKLLTDKGWAGRTVAIEHIGELKETIERAKNDACLSEDFRQTCLTFFDFEPPAELPQASSVIIVAVTTPVSRIYCTWKEQRVAVLIPPTYVNFFGRIREVQDTLTSWLAAAGYKTAQPKLPLKNLAVRSALAKYGRNNICFVPDMGSYLQLVGLYTDLPCVEDSWMEPQSLEKCDDCDACLRHCPTGAILPERFLIQADRCLTFFNEGASSFPDWINPEWHNCLIGCLRCQSICPENRAVRKCIEDLGEFCEEETTMLVKGTPLDSLPKSTADKLHQLHLTDHELLCRNLAAIIDRHSS